MSRVQQRRTAGERELKKNSFVLVFVEAGCFVAVRSVGIFQSKKENISERKYFGKFVFKFENFSFKLKKVSLKLSKKLSEKCRKKSVNITKSKRNRARKMW